jgi:hypothetical protein
MIDRCTIKVTPAVSHKNIIKTFEATKKIDLGQLKKLQHLKIKIEVVGEAGDYKKISDLIKELAKK